MELRDLKGRHILDAVDFCEKSLEIYDDYFENCSVCRFRLDDVVYVAIEDPSDGYRSSMRELIIDSEAVMTNSFPPIEVVAKYRSGGSYSDAADIIELIDIESGEVVLEIGTINTDDYYPCYVASFHPESMITNK